MSRPRRVVFHIGGVLLVVVAALTAFVLTTSRRRAEAREGAARHEALAAGPRVTAAKVQRMPPGRTVTMSGEAHAFRQTTLYAKVSGYLKAIKVDKGDKVKAGDVLGVIEAPELAEDAQSKRADVSIRKLNAARAKALEANGLASRAALEQANADLQIANAELSRLETMRGYEVIKAPFDGVVTMRYADEGALLQAATASQSALPLVDIADLSSVRVFVYLAQNDALFVHEGDPVTLWADERPDARIAAKVTRFAKQLDPRTRTMLTEIDIANVDDAPLYPGTFVRAAITLNAPSSLAVPADAITFRKGKPNVAVVRADGRAAFVPVDAGDSDGKLVRVNSGVSEGDRVILHPGDDVTDGAPVQVVENRS